LTPPSIHGERHRDDVDRRVDDDEHRDERDGDDRDNDASPDGKANRCFPDR
jgi:hypothetical protein